MMLDLIDNGPLVCPTVEENEQTKPKKYSELTEAQQLQDDCDVQETNIILHGASHPFCINLLTIKEAGLKDNFGIDSSQYQVSESLPSKWSKFVTDVKLAKSLYTTNYDQLYVYLSQHERHANEVRISHERYRDSLAFVANSPTLCNPSQSPQHSGMFTEFKGNVATAPPRIMKCYNCQVEGHMARQSVSDGKIFQAVNPEVHSEIMRYIVVVISLCTLNIYKSHKMRLFRILIDTNLSAPNDLLVLSLVEQMTDHIAHLDKENQTNKMVNESLTAELKRYKERVSIFEQRQNVNLNKHEKLIDSQMDYLIWNRNAKLAAFQQEINTLKETLSNHVKEKESLSKTLTGFKIESKEKESKYIDKEIVLEKQNKKLENIISLGFQNPFNLKKAQRIQPTLYDGSVIAKEHAVIYVIDDEETLILEEESRSKMLDKQNDPISIENKIKISSIDYSKLNKLKEDFGRRFVTQKELFAEQAIWLKHSSISKTPVTSQAPVRIEAPSELHKVSLVNESLKRLKYQLANFDKIVKKRTTSDAITVEIVHIAVNSVDILDVKKSCVNECNKCLELEIEFHKKKDFIEKEAYDKLVKSYSTLEKHCISLELATQLNQEIFQRENSGENLNAPTFNQLFKINELNAQSQENDTVIRKLKDRFKSLSRKDSVENVKKDIDEIETINIDLERNQFESIRKTRVQSKEHCDSLIAQINAKSVENSDLNAQLQEKVFAIAALKNELKKLMFQNLVPLLLQECSSLA
ncbi:retrovirus-related pol polyprotein from transposon TNT 1-94 [Tanacetum coccineum]